MNIKEIMEKMKKIQNNLLEFLGNESNEEENYENLIQVIKDSKLNEDPYNFKSFLRLINNIGNNHQRICNFIHKLEQILSHFKNDIQKYFTNSEIFTIFESNKRILLFLIENKIMIIDEYIVSQITSDQHFGKKYSEYFWPEIKPFLTKEFISKYGSENHTLKSIDFTKEISEDFYEKRKKGENDNFLCELIRTNKAKEFGIHINRQNIPFDSIIPESIFETNEYLTCKQPKMIEYAAFFGSIEIIKYLQINGEVELTSKMWIHAVHSQNGELMNYLEDKHVSPPKDSFLRVLKESIKCHHKKVSYYIIRNLIKEEDLRKSIEDNYLKNFYRYAVECYNFSFFPENMKRKNMFIYLCESDYYTLVKIYLEEGNIDINAGIIQKHQFFQMKF